MAASSSLFGSSFTEVTTTRGARRCGAGGLVVARVPHAVSTMAAGRERVNSRAVGVVRFIGVRAYWWSRVGSRRAPRRVGAGRGTDARSARTRISIAWHVARWGDNRSQTARGARWRQAERPPIERRWGARRRTLRGGGRCHQRRGAVDDPRRVRRGCASRPLGDDEVRARRAIVVGAGFAGLGAARTLHDPGVDVTVVEARDRIGGWAPTPSSWVRACTPTPALRGCSSATPLARAGGTVGPATVPTDFHAPLAGAPDGPVDDGEVAAAFARHRRRVQPVPAMHRWTMSPPPSSRRTPDERRTRRHAIDLDIDLENGVAHDRLSARSCSSSPASARRPVAARRLRAVAPPSRHRSRHPPLRTRCADRVGRERCRRRRPPRRLCDLRHPGLAAAQDQTVARAAGQPSRRRSPSSPPRWWRRCCCASKSDGGRPRRRLPPVVRLARRWGEWLDLTDGVGVPVVAALIAGDAVRRQHHGRDDAAIALDVTRHAGHVGGRRRGRRSPLNRSASANCTSAGRPAVDHPRQPRPRGHRRAPRQRRAQQIAVEARCRR